MYVVDGIPRPPLIIAVRSQCTQDGRPIEVQITWIVYEFADISGPTESYCVGMYVFGDWHDPSLVGKTAADENVNARTVWSPRLELANASGDVDIRFETFDLKPGGHVHCEAKVRATLQNRMCLRSFPFDRQTLLIKFEPVAGQAHDVVLVPGCPIAVNKGVTSDLYLPEWHLTQAGATSEIRTFEADNTAWSCLTATFEVRRDPGFYLSRIVSTLTILLVLSLCTFMIDIREVGDRLSVTMTLALTIVAFQMVVAELIPKVPVKILQSTFVD